MVSLTLCRFFGPPCTCTRLCHAGWSGTQSFCI